LVALYGLLVSIPAGAVAQQTQEQAIRIQKSRVTGFASFVTPRTGKTIPVAAQVAQGGVQPMDFLNQYGPVFGVADPVTQLRERGRAVDNLGQTHTTFNQVHQGVPVFSGILKVHQDAAGNVLAANGDFYPIRTTLSVQPTLDRAAAIAAARAAIGLANPTIGKCDLVIVDPGWYGDPPRGDHLAYYVVVSDPRAGIAEAVFVEAQTGEILDRWSLIHLALDREVYDGNGGQLFPASPVRSEGEASDPAEHADVDRAYDYAGDIYDYYSRAFGRDSIDGLGLTMQLLAHLQQLLDR